jgi:dolichol kinase
MQEKSVNTLHYYSIKRRLLHLAGSLFIMYYFIPEFLLYSVHKAWILIVILLLVGSIEWYRSYSNKIHKIEPLLRDYERVRPASYSYFSVGAIILLAYFPQYIAIPCILSASICDPFIGIMKQQNEKRAGLIIGFFISFMLFYFSWQSTLFWIAMGASLLGAAMVILAEQASNLWLDDDLLMQIIPSIILFIFLMIIEKLSALPPTNIIYAF